MASLIHMSRQPSGSNTLPVSPPPMEHVVQCGDELRYVGGALPIVIYYVRGSCLNRAVLRAKGKEGVIMRHYFHVSESSLGGGGVIRIRNCHSGSQAKVMRTEGTEVTTIKPTFNNMCPVAGWIRRTVGVSMRSLSFLYSNLLRKRCAGFY
ncbi:hypothetical protein BJV78DRAFT_937612 [Lactifluus subvellereus]|nr:hypothetical protein BJV78DRAFT_937612 [Lactifluus subvellereus]